MHSTDSPVQIPKQPHFHTKANFLLHAKEATNIIQNMDSPQDLTSDQAVLKIASEDGEDTIEPKPRRKSILKLAPESLPADQRRPSKRVAFAAEVDEPVQTKLAAQEELPQLSAKQSKCCLLW